MSDDDTRWMREALALAEKAWGDTHPNPMVGAIVVRDGEAVGRGWHERAGAAHAEPVALEQAGARARGATLYVTLEPCSTQGRRPPCVDAIVAAGVRRVVVGATDPNPAHAGRAFGILGDHGIEVTTGVLERECTDLNLIFNHWITTGRPIIAAKVATTICGRIATRMGHSHWITGEEARADVHRWRRYFPAIAIGRGTVMADNPRLTSRPPFGQEWCPVRFVFDRSLDSARRPLPGLYRDDFRERTTVVTGREPPADRAAMLESQGVRLLRLPGSPDEAMIAAFIDHCANEGITGVYIEGGNRLVSSFLTASALDYLFAYRAPVILGDDAAISAFSGGEADWISEAWRLRDIRHATLGDDQLMRGHLVKGEGLPDLES